MTYDTPVDLPSDTLHFLRDHVYPVIDDNDPLSEPYYETVTCPRCGKTRRREWTQNPVWREGRSSSWCRPCSNRRTLKRRMEEGS